MNTVVIIHFQPLELYPPIQNLIRALEVHSLNARVIVITTSTHLKLNTFQSDTIRIVRIGVSNNRSTSLKRYWNYFVFYAACFIHLVGSRPKAILYYETLSSFPAWLYKKFIKRNTSIFIHYHEYTEPKAYATGMFLERIFHKLEMSLYPIARWVSHTNTYRMKKFKHDLLPIVPHNAEVMPNYPPRSWFGGPRSVRSIPLKVVYAGALSLQTMYVHEFATWVLQQNGGVRWDIYSYNSSPEMVHYIKTLNSPWVSLRAGVDYDQLPAVLKQYDVGVVLYKGHIPNYIYNAPNKLFEYHVCGLDVWFPEIMIGSLPYVTQGTYPSIKAVDFTRLKSLVWESVYNHSGLIYDQKNYYSDVEFESIINALFLVV